MKTNRSKNYLKQIVMMVFSIVALNTLALANIGKPFPANSVEVEGAFSGTQYVNGKARSVDVLIHGGSMSGSFIVTLLVSERRELKAQLFYAEILEQKTFGVMALALKDNNKYWSQVNPPAGLMKILVDRRNIIQSIEISPQDGVTLLEGPVALTSASRNYSVSDVLAQGEYASRTGGSRSDVLRIYKSSVDNVLVSGSVQALGISNDYNLNFDLTGVGALRSRTYDDHFQQRERAEVSALVLPILVSGKAGLVVIRSESSNDQINGPAVIMRLK